MSPATAPRPRASLDRLLLVDGVQEQFRDAHLRELPGLLRRADLLVVNDAATLPASLRGTDRDGRAVELRIASLAEDETAWVLLLGSGDHRTPTEHRAPPPALRADDEVRLGEDLHARVLQIASISPRLVHVRFDRRGAALWSALYRHGRPVQYAHVPAPLALWDVQNAYSSRPWASELPSAGRPLGEVLLGQLRERGVEVARLTHAAGLSSTGDPAIDAALPLPERYEVPAATGGAIAEAKLRGGRVIAVGTSVVRALEGAMEDHGTLVGVSGITALRIGPRYRPRVVDGLLTGMHEAGASHLALLAAFAPESVLATAYHHAEATGYLAHEFGDSCLVLGRVAA